MDNDKQELAKALERFNTKADELLNSTTNTANVNVNAGGIGLWLCVSLCLMMFSANLALGAIVISNSRKIDELNHYLTAIYMMAPELKSREQEDIE